MNNFKAGDTVVVVGVTDLDGDFVKAGTMITDPKHEATMDWQNPPQTLIGQIGSIMDPAMNDYYDVTVSFPWNAENEDLAFKAQDVKVVTAWRVTGDVPTPMRDPKRPVFDHDESTRPPVKGKASKPYPVDSSSFIGDKPRASKISVTTTNRNVAESLARAFGRGSDVKNPVYENVKVEPVTA